MKVESKKLQAKDLINVGVFTAIYFVIFFAGMMLGYIPIFIPLLGLVCPILCGIPFMLYLTKVKKFGMVSLTGIILGLLNLIMGSGVLVLIFGIIFGIISDLILRAGKYQSWKCTLLGNGVFSLWIMGYVSRDVFDPRYFLRLTCEQLWTGICRHTHVLYPWLDVSGAVCCYFYWRHFGGASWQGRVEEAF